MAEHKSFHTELICERDRRSCQFQRQLMGSPQVFEDTHIQQARPRIQMSDPAIVDSQVNLYLGATVLANAWVQHFVASEGGHAVEAEAIAEIVFCGRDRIISQGYSGLFLTCPPGSR